MRFSIKTFIVLCFTLAIVGCDSVSSTDDSQINDSYLEQKELEPLTSNAPTTASNTNIVGTWVLVSEYGDVEKATFSAGGNGNITDGEFEPMTVPFTWKLDGSVLAVSVEFSEAFEGETCTEIEQMTTSVAQAGDLFYLNALVRTAGAEGSGAKGSNDGTWMMFDGEVEEFSCGEEYEKGAYSRLLTIKITGATFTATDDWEWTETESGGGPIIGPSAPNSGDSDGDSTIAIDDEGEGSESVSSPDISPKKATGADMETDSDSGVDTYEGTVTQEEEYLVLRATSGKVFTLNPISANAMLFADDEPLYAEDYWNGTIYQRQ